MLTVEEALDRCLSVTLPVRSESVPLALALGRILAEPVLAGHPLPPWDNSAMDGYAVRSGDTAKGPTSALPDDCEQPASGASGVVLDIVEVIPAGHAPQVELTSGQAARIFTGAPMPRGADSVVMQEHAEALDSDRVRLHGSVHPGQNVRRAGEEVEPGQQVLDAGVPLTPARIGVCAALGKDAVVVAARPRVAVLSTGDEIVPPGQPLGPGQIWSSNAAALVAWVEVAGGEAIDCGNAPDDADGTRRAFQRALDTQPDLLISTGGVSVGDFDVVKQVLGDLGVEMSFSKIAMKPGKPLAFGTIGGVPVFGLPGNPVSCQVGFLQFVRPVLRRALGDPSPHLPVVDAVLVERITKRPGRAELVRVALSRTGGRLEARSAGPQGSGRSSSLAVAHGLLLLGPRAIGAEAGDRVSVQVFDWSFADGAGADYRWSGRLP